MTTRDKPASISGATDDASKANSASRLAVLVPVIIVVCVGCVFSVGAYLIVASLEDRERRDRFNHLADTSFDHIEETIDDAVSILRSIVGFYAGSRHVGRDEFHTFVDALGEQHGVQALEWIPRVPLARREAFEEAARQNGFSNFAFTERRSPGQLVQAAKREEYFPVYFVEPYTGNEAALGFDLGSNAARLQALRQARDSGSIVATSRITLVQETGDQYGFLVFVPIYRNGAPRVTTAERHANLNGFGLGVFRIGDLADEAVAGHSSPQSPLTSPQRSLTIEIFDLSAPEESRRLYPKTAASGGDVENFSHLRSSRRMTVANRNWLLVATSSTTFINEIAPSWRLWAVLVAGVLFTSMMALYVIQIVNRNREINFLVEERTAKLFGANEELEVINKELDAFAHSVSHDLRAPLRGIDGFSQALIQDYGDKFTGEAKDYLNRISKASRRMGQMIDDILNLSRATRQDLQTQHIDLSALAKELLAELRKRDPDRNVAIKIAPNIMARGDPRLLQVVLNNLLDNAWKFTGKKKVRPDRIWSVF